MKIDHLPPDTGEMSEIREKSRRILPHLSSQKATKGTKGTKPHPADGQQDRVWYPDLPCRQCQQPYGDQTNYNELAFPDHRLR
jgi:hypothetical protein